MIRLYRLKDREVREIEDDQELVLRCLKRAGFVIGNLPPLPKPKEPVVEEPLPPTEGEDVDGAEEGEPVLAKHAPVDVPLQEVDTDAEESMQPDPAPEEGAEDGEVVGTDEPPEGTAPEPKAFNVLVGMNMKELRAVAKEHNITVPFEIKSKVELADFLAEQLPPVESEEDDG